ncbi:MAG: hypothetical protein AAB655_00100 [Patescibacteria group bacterium]
MDKKSFLEKLQSADEGRKKKIMFVSTVVIMTAVIYVWLAYFNSLIAPTTQPDLKNESAEGGDFTFWQTMKKGMAAIYGILGDKVSDLGGILEAPREYIIKPPK